MSITRGGSFIRTLDEEISSYSHTIVCDGGFKTATVSLKEPNELIDDWIANGIGRHIICHGPGGGTIWEGFVDNVSVNYGGISVERGRLTDLCNRVSATYTPIIDDTVDPPITGTTTETVIAEDSESQAKYGIWEKIISAGTVLDADAEYVRDAFLQEYKELEVSHQISMGGGGGDITVSLDCKGYIEWLGNYAYNDITVPLSVEASTKVTSVLASDPNDIISPDMGEIDYNGILVPSYEDKNRMGSEIINEIVTYGDINDNRWMFGIYEDRIAHYKAIPSTVEYLHYMGAEAQQILNVAYGEVKPWNVRPGKICVIPDTVIGRFTMYTGIRLDPRVMFLEQITFTAPNGIELQGKKIRNLAQLMAKMGLSGL
jgi:hypothetical protein